MMMGRVGGGVTPLPLLSAYRQSLLSQTEGNSRWTEEALRAYVPAPVLANMAAAKIGWAAESRALTVLFLWIQNGLEDVFAHPDANALDKLQTVFHSAQKVLYSYECVIKEFTMDDKGCVIVAGFGISPFVHTDDPARAVLASMSLLPSLQAVGVDVKIGIVTGIAFCASIGGERKEYAMIGPTVNLAARFMAHKTNPGIMVSEETMKAS